MTPLKLFVRAASGLLILALGVYGFHVAVFLFNLASNLAFVGGALLILLTIYVVVELGRRTLLRPW